MPEISRAEVLGVVEIYQQLPPARQVPHVELTSRSDLQIPDEVLVGILAPRGTAPLPASDVPKAPDRTIFAPSVWTAPDGKVLYFSAMYIWKTGDAHSGFAGCPAPFYHLSIYAIIADAYCDAAACDWLKHNAEKYEFQNYPHFLQQSLVGESPLNLVRWFGIGAFVKIFFASLARAR